jgi:hypothetical protein
MCRIKKIRYKIIKLMFTIQKLRSKIIEKKKVSNYHIIGAYDVYLPIHAEIVKNMNDWLYFMLS